jgi:hypothetical protein
MSNELKSPVRLSDNAVSALATLRNDFTLTVNSIIDTYKELKKRERQQNIVKHEHLDTVFQKYSDEVFKKYLEAAFAVARADIGLPDDAHFMINQEQIDQGIVFAIPCIFCNHDDPDEQDNDDDDDDDDDIVNAPENDVTIN